MRAEPPRAKARTCSTVAMVVSPGKVVSSAPCAPAVPVGRVDLAQGGRDGFHVREHLVHMLDGAKEGVRVERRRAGHVRPGDAEALLQVFLVADEHVHVLDDACNDFHGLP